MTILLFAPDLLVAYRTNDRAVMAAYGFDLKMSESDCVAELFKLDEVLAGAAERDVDAGKDATGKGKDG